MSRQRVEAARAQEIAWRLSKFVMKTFAGWYRFQQRTGIPRSTLLAWRRKRDLSVPDVPYLLRFAADYQLNPSWLLLGIGSERIERTGLPEPIEERLRETLIADLATLEGVSRRRVGRCLPPAELVYRAALVEMKRMLKVMMAWDRDAANAERRLRRRLKAAEKAGQTGKGTDWQEKLTEMKARHREERTAFMAREIASWAAKEDATTRRPLEPRRPWPRHLA